MVKKQNNFYRADNVMTITLSALLLDQSTNHEKGIQFSVNKRIIKGVVWKRLQ